MCVCGGGPMLALWGCVHIGAQHFAKLDRVQCGGSLEEHKVNKPAPLCEGDVCDPFSHCLLCVLSNAGKRAVMVSSCTRLVHGGHVHSLQPMHSWTACC